MLHQSVLKAISWILGVGLIALAAVAWLAPQLIRIEIAAVVFLVALTLAVWGVVKLLGRVVRSLPGVDCDPGE